MLESVAGVLAEVALVLDYLLTNAFRSNKFRLPKVLTLTAPFSTTIVFCKMGAMAKTI